jgi:hypothetical protein
MDSSLRGFTQSAASAAEQMSSATEQLASMAQELQTMMAQFKIADGDGKDAMQPVRDRDAGSANGKGTRTARLSLVEAR